MAAPSQAEEAAWSAACETFFLDGDAEAASLIDALQSSDPSASTTVSFETETDLARATGLRAACGSSAARTRYLALKDAARARAHGAALERRRAGLDAALARRVRPLPPPRSWARLRIALDAYRDASRDWRETPGPASTIVAGVERLVREQAATDAVLRWRVDAAAVHEPGEKFRDATLALARTLVGDDGLGAVEEESLLWALDPAWSDRSLRRVLAAAPAGSAPPHGSLERTDRPRTDADGDGDEAVPFFDRLLVLGEFDMCPIL